MGNKDEKPSPGKARRRVQKSEEEKVKPEEEKVKPDGPVATDPKGVKPSMVLQVLNLNDLIKIRDVFGTWLSYKETSFSVGQSYLPHFKKLQQELKLHGVIDPLPPPPKT